MTISAEEIKSFIQKVEAESQVHKFLQLDIINQIIHIFNIKIEKSEYAKKIQNPIELVLEFYKSYDKKYYELILKGIKAEKIIINTTIKKSHVDVETNKVYIGLNNNDSDIFILVHEFAHFIDRNSNLVLVPEKFWFLSEVYSFYMEKQLELWLKDKRYEDVISKRRKNRLYYEAKMVKVIKYAMHYENIYQKKGKLEQCDLNEEEIKIISSYQEPNLVNYLLQYPLANILSDYFIQNKVLEIEPDLVNKCCQLDLYEVLKEYKIEQKDLKKIRITKL